MQQTGSEFLSPGHNRHSFLARGHSGVEVLRIRENLGTCNFGRKSTKELCVTCDKMVRRVKREGAMSALLLARTIVVLAFVCGTHAAGWMPKHGSELMCTARALGAPGRGILAADESTGTIAKRFASIGVDNTELNRQKYRQMVRPSPFAALCERV